jgi:hypothetical protein
MPCIAIRAYSASARSLRATLSATLKQAPTARQLTRREGKTSFRYCDVWLDVNIHSMLSISSTH